MISANLTEVEVPSLLEKLGLMAEDEQVHVACINSPTNVTLSGPADSIKIIQGHLDQQGVFAKTVQTGVAYHSPVRVFSGPMRLEFSCLTSGFECAVWQGECLSIIILILLQDFFWFV